MMLDEQSFQDMLAAAFTIQEHNAQRKRRLQLEPLCQCGAPLKDSATLCQRCSGEGSRPGEDLQRKWASLWMMSQEQGLSPERSSPAQAKTELAQAEANKEWQTDAATKEFPARHFPDALEIPVSEEEIADHLETERESGWPGAALINVGLATQERGFIPEVDVSSLEPLEAIDGEATPAPWSLRDLRLKLRFHRADLYLVVAIGVATVAMLWVLAATPTPGAHRKPRLRPWERALIAVGLAEAPEPPPRRGDPNIQVWVDPKTALYYCAGEELYGKAPGGHIATQREAQMDQFQPAGRAACE
jgi:hypothetical protein